MSTHHGVPTNHGATKSKSIPNKAAEGISYYTPAQHPPSGTASDPQPNNSPIPKLFTPLRLRGLTLQNRIALSPLCQYSADNGHLTAWHTSHLGGIISRGPSLSFVEATSVTANGRITPEDSGLWLDSQIAPLQAITEFANSQGQKIGIQLGHAGRKASTVAPWLAGGAVATKDVGGWPDDVWGPSAIAYNEDHATPHALTIDGIAQLKADFLAAVKRALKAGFDVIEIHNAHGYLLHNFISPATNHRTDQYGGSFENRVRLTLEIVELTRKEIPDSMPLFLRISASDWLDANPEYEGESWTLEDTIRLAPLLAERGVDLLDVSSAGAHPLQKITTGPGYQVPFAKAIKQALGADSTLRVSSVGTITAGKQAEAILTGKGEGSHGDTELDLVVVGRMFQKNPGLVWAWAEELGTQINVANQIRWGFGGRPGAPKK